MAVPPNQMTPILVVVHARCFTAEAVQHYAFSKMLKQTYARR